MTSAPQSPAPQPSAPQSAPPSPPAPLSPAGTSTVPVPPRGPGVVVPFAAPPRDPDKSRLAVGIVVGVVAFVLVCGGLLGTAVGVLVWSSHELTEQSTRTADAFLSDLVAEDYEGAYDSLCERTRGELTESEFTQEWSQVPVVAAQTSGLQAQQQDFVINATITYDNEIEKDIRLTVVVEEPNMNLAVCDWG